MRPAVFIDKDGTLLEDTPYNVDPARMRFAPGGLLALKTLAEAGWALVVVTNQPGLALGYFNWAEFDRCRRALVGRVKAEAGVPLTAVYACPHAPGPTGQPICDCRKPRPGLLLHAAQRHGLDLQRSWMVGDILDDIEAGRSAGCRTVLLDVGNETEWQRGPLREPHHRCRDLGAAARTILSATSLELT